jgi:hypothetical protein
MCSQRNNNIITFKLLNIHGDFLQNDGLSTNELNVLPLTVQIRLCNQLKCYILEGEFGNVMYLLSGKYGVIPVATL